jgi:hypothetical protein
MYDLQTLSHLLYVISTLPDTVTLYCLGNNDEGKSVHAQEAIVLGFFLNLCDID